MQERFSAYSVTFVDQSDSADSLLFKVSSASDPGMLMLVSHDAIDKPIGITRYRDQLRGTDLGRVIATSYAARDGQIIPAFITLPPAVPNLSPDEQLPFVVLPHREPHDRDSQRFDYIAQFFATRGFATLQMNYRGSSGYGKSFEESGRNDWELMTEDVTDGARWLITQGYADQERICIAGWSFGGYAALIGAIENPDLYACVISVGGITDPRELAFDYSKYHRGRMRANRFVLAGLDSRESRSLNSPLLRAGELRTPLFMAHGELNVRVHYDHLTHMRSALKKTDVLQEYLILDNEDYYVSNQENRIMLFVRLDEFLRKTVGGSEFAQ